MRVNPADQKTRLEAYYKLVADFEAKQAEAEAARDRMRQAAQELRELIRPLTQELEERSRDAPR